MLTSPLLYCHYDVQPLGNEEIWGSPPQGMCCVVFDDFVLMGDLVQLLPAIRHEERSDIPDSPERKRRGPGDVEQLRRGERRPHRKAGWEEVQEVSVSFDTSNVGMLDFETDYQDFPDESLISHGQADNEFGGT